MPASNAAGWPVSGAIVFEVLRGENGLKIGEAHHSWRYGGQDYRMENALETTGLAAMLADFRYVQRSEGRVTVDGLRPDRFSVERQGREPESARFDRTKGIVAIERRGRVREHPIAADDQDVLSIWHLFGLQRGRSYPSEIGLVSNREAVQATIEVIGPEALRVPAGRMDTLKVRIAARSGKLRIDLWLSEAHDLLPVRILMTDDKGQVLDQRAMSIERSEARIRTKEEDGAKRS